MKDEEAPPAPDEQGVIGIATFEASVRRGFVRKVFGLLLIQLAIAFGTFALMVNTDSIVLYLTGCPSIHVTKNDYQAGACTPNQLGLLFGSFFGIVLFLLMMACSPTFTRVHPYNLMALLAFTLCEGLFMGTVAAPLGLKSVFEVGRQTTLVAMVCAIGVAFVLVAFGLQSKVDFESSHAPYIIVFVWVLSLMIASSILGYATVVGSVVIGLFMAAFGTYIVYDASLIVGGKHRSNVYGVDDYVFASVSLFTDILSLFMLMILCGGGAAAGAPSQKIDDR